ncbi:MAG: APC family permease [Armatimonadota bacterium]
MANMLRRLIFGRPFETAKAHHTRLPNALALPVFASDALSSVSYATEEILLVLVLAGASVSVLSKSWPVALAIALLLAIVATSYRQTIHAYPQGGGAYRVSRENLGPFWGVMAGASLLIDYVLTVAVSISAGVAAITSAWPTLAPYAVWLAVAFIVFVGLANLRGAKESGLLFAVPTYLFIGSIFTMLGVGFFKLLTNQPMTPPVPPTDTWANTTESLTLFLILRAFSSGCTALTGIEAVTDGVPAFRPPEAKNAAKVLAILGVILITMFVGITYLAHRLEVVPFPAEFEGPNHEHRHTVVSQIAYAVFGQTPFYYVLQAATAVILILAANTAFVDFPRLSMFLAQDKLLPRQLANVGDRLVYSNGIIGLSVLSILTVVAFNASTHHLIPLYALGVFLSFTLSQSGMVVRWLRLRPRGWQMGAAVSGVGALATFVVLIIIGVTKFMAGDPVSLWPVTTPLGLWLVLTLGSFVLISMWHRWMGRWLLALSTLGFAAWALAAQPDLLRSFEVRLGAWLVMVAIPTVIWMCFRINAHYDDVAGKLTMERYQPPRKFRHTVLVSVPGVHRGIMPALEYARSIGGDVRGVYVEIDPARTPQALERWRKWVPDIPLVVLDSPYRALTTPLLEYIDQVERERDDDVVTVILPEFVPEKWWTVLLHNQTGLMLKWALLFKKGVVLTNIRYHLQDWEEEALGAHPLLCDTNDPDCRPASTSEAEELGTGR